MRQRTPSRYNSTEQSLSAFCNRYTALRGGVQDNVLAVSKAYGIAQMHVRFEAFLLK
jgi:hypothetical protein